MQCMYLLDSNILIYYLDELQAIVDFVDAIKPSAYISTISITELLAKPGLTKKQVHSIQSFLDQFMSLDVDKNTAITAAALKRKYTLTFPDAMIAATALLFDLTLVSRDKVFGKVREINHVIY